MVSSPFPPLSFLQLFDARVTELTRQLDFAERTRAEEVGSLEEALGATRSSQQEVLNQIQENFMAASQQYETTLTVRKAGLLLCMLIHSVILIGVYMYYMYSHVLHSCMSQGAATQATYGLTTQPEVNVVCLFVE